MGKCSYVIAVTCIPMGRNGLICMQYPEKTAQLSLIINTDRNICQTFGGKPYTYTDPELERLSETFVNVLF